MNLKKTALLSSVWLALQLGGKQLLNSLTFFVIAAFISPEELGIGVLSLSLAYIFRILIAKGLKETLIREPTLTAEILSNALWLNLAVGVVFAVWLILFSPWLGALLRISSHAHLLNWSACIFIATCLSTVSEAIIERDFRHRRLTISQLIASLVGAFVGIWAASTGKGPAAFVSYKVVEISIYSGLVVYFAGWRPVFHVSLQATKKLVQSALPLSLSSAFTAGNVRIAEIIIGIVLGQAATSFFRIAIQVNQLINQLVINPIVRIILPIFVHIAEQSQKAHYLTLLSITSAISFPIFLGISAILPPFIATIFGDSWAPAASIISILVFAVFATMPMQVTSPVAIALGKSYSILFANICIVLVGLCALYIGAQHSLQVAVLCFVCRSFIAIPIAELVANKIVGVQWFEVSKRIMAFGLLAASMHYLSSFIIASGHDLLGMSREVSALLAISTGVFYYLVGLRVILPMFFPTDYQSINSLLRAVRE